MEYHQSNMAKVLVVDDDATLAGLIKDVFEAHDVTVAPDGETGLAMVRALLPDLVVLDIGLPKMDGVAVCREIKRDPALRAKVKVMMLTGKGAMGDVEQAFGGRADDYMVKPFSPRVLLARAEALLAKKS